MKKRYVNLILAMASASVLVLGSVPAMAKTDETKTESGEEAEASEEKDTDVAKADTLEDGVYTAEFETDSSMFHVNEANDKKGELTVKDGKMTIHVSLVSKKIVNLFAGTAEDAQKDGAEIIDPTTDTVKYSDGYTEEVYGFDIPVPAIGEEINVTARKDQEDCFPGRLLYLWKGEDYHEKTLCKLNSCNGKCISPGAGLCACDGKNR